LASTGLIKTDLRKLKQETTLLNKRFALWPRLRPREWMPYPLGTVEVSSNLAQHDTNHRSGRINIYSDLYVAAVWNTYRKARQKLMNIIVACSERSVTSGNSAQNRDEVNIIVDDMFASVPFHLIADLPSQLQIGSLLESLGAPGKSLGGLLMMYPWYVVSSWTFLSPEQRIWMSERLRWIGSRMGIQQATRLSNVCYLVVRVHC
ncbi:hypothetical protein BJ878DRAFT_425253, partial [Calycina marina]